VVLREVAEVRIVARGVAERPCTRGSSTASTATCRASTAI
jgi:hypothetical protein